jgi:hypothetical protein
MKYKLTTLLLKLTVIQMTINAWHCCNILASSETGITNTNFHSKCECHNCKMYAQSTSNLFVSQLHPQHTLTTRKMTGISCHRTVQCWYPLNAPLHKKNNKTHDNFKIKEINLYHSFIIHGLEIKKKLFPIITAWYHRLLWVRSTHTPPPVRRQRLVWQLSLLYTRGHFEWRQKRNAYLCAQVSCFNTQLSYVFRWQFNLPCQLGISY